MHSYFVQSSATKQEPLMRGHVFGHRDIEVFSDPIHSWKLLRYKSSKLTSPIGHTSERFMASSSRAAPAVHLNRKTTKPSGESYLPDIAESSHLPVSGEKISRRGILNSRLIQLV